MKSGESVCTRIWGDESEEIIIQLRWLIGLMGHREGLMGHCDGWYIKESGGHYGCGY